MKTDNLEFEYKKIEEQLIAYVRCPLNQRIELQERFNLLRRECDEFIIGPAMISYHFDTGVKDGVDVEAAYPVSESIEAKGVSTRVLESVEALTTTYHGSYDGISKAWQQLREYRNSRALPHGLSPREVYVTGPFMSNPDDNVTELQATIHDWDCRFHSALGEIIGELDQSEILQGHEKLTPFTCAEDRADWVINALMKLDQSYTEEQKYEVISRCAHVRPHEEIANLKAVYDMNMDIDEFIEYFGNSLPFIEKPYREGNIIYQSKPPADPEGYKNAKTQHELIKTACFCPIIQTALDRMPKTFCYCGAGWARQMFEEVLGEKLRIEVVSTVIDGDRFCKYAIHMPPHLVPSD